MCWYFCMRLGSVPDIGCFARGYEYLNEDRLGEDGRIEPVGVGP
jgi:hypothetical protein